MNCRQNTAPAHWIEIREHVRTKWGKLSKKDIDSVRDDMNQLVNVVQRVYRVPTRQAEREYHEFRVSHCSIF